MYQFAPQFAVKGRVRGHFTSHKSMMAMPIRAAAQAEVFPAPKPLPPLRKIKAVLFDIDGTLCNSDPLHYEAFREILAEVGFNSGEPITEEFFLHQISGRSNPLIAASLFPNKSEEWHREFYTDKELRYRRLAASGLEEMPGLTAFLDWMDAEGIRRVAVTNAPRENVEVMMEGLGIRSRFEKIVLGDECTRPKPFPDPYLEGLAYLGMSADEAIALEDSPSGLKAAVRAGIPTLGMLSGHAAEPLVEAGACALVEDYRELLTLLKTGTGGRVLRGAAKFTAQ